MFDQIYDTKEDAFHAGRQTGRADRHTDDAHEIVRLRALSETRAAALEAARHKLTLYREQHSGEYIGGMEYTALLRMIDTALQA